MCYVECGEGDSSYESNPTNTCECVLYYVINAIYMQIKVQCFPLKWCDVLIWLCDNIFLN